MWVRQARPRSTLTRNSYSFNRAICFYGPKFGPLTTATSLPPFCLLKDFSKLVYAPILYKDMSSFGLWAAMANDGIVHATRM